MGSGSGRRSGCARPLQSRGAMSDCRTSRHYPTALAVVLILAGSSAAAQAPGRITGSIADAVTSKPLVDVEVRIAGSDLRTVTGTEGTYTIEGVPPGLVRVTAQVIGYHPITTPYYSLRPDSSLAVNFKLAPVTVRLDPVEVTADAPASTRTNLSRTVITREQLPASGDLLQNLQGTVVGLRTSGRHDRTQVSIRGSTTEPLYVVDGTVITPPLTFYIDVNEVECVEVRRGYTAAQEFRPSINSETYSGVIIIWTRGSLGEKPRGCTPGG